MIVFKSKLINEKLYNEILSANSEQNPGYIIKRLSSEKIIYVKKRQQDMTAQYSTPFVGKIIFDQEYSTIKGFFIPAFQMTIFRIFILGMLFYCLTPVFFTYGHWNIGDSLLLAILFIAEAAGIRKKRQIKCEVIQSIKSTFQAELVSPKGKYQQKKLKRQDQYEIWHCGLFLVAYIVFILICLPPFAFGIVISILAKVWYGVVFFMGFTLATVATGIIHTEWLWRIRFNNEGVALKLLWREKVSFKWDEIQEIGLAPVSTYARGIPTGIQVWVFISRDHLVYNDFREVMKKNERDPEIIWLIYNKKNYEILRQFYKGDILNFDYLKSFTQ